MRILALCAALIAVPSSAFAARTIAVLAFGGDDGASARTRIVSVLSRRYTVLGGNKILDACDELGIKMSRGPNLAKAAQHVGAVAVIGGSAAGSRLALAIYSGRDGQPIAAKAMRWGASVRYLKKAISLILVALQKAPRRVGRRKPKPKPVPTPLPRDDPKPAVVAKSSNDPDPIQFDPDPVAKSNKPSKPNDSSQSNDPDEDPFSLGTPKSASAAKTPAASDTAATDAKVKKKKSDSNDPRTRLAGTVGLGTWMRSFALNDPVLDGNRSHPEYASGAAFALRIALSARPLSFLTDGIAGNFYARFRFTTTIGLSSRVPNKAEGLSTSMNEWLLDFGYDFLFGDSATAPDLSLGIGYGGLGFGIEWVDGVQPSLPNASYGFVLITADFSWPFLGWLGLDLHFDYRVVTGTGEIENSDPDRWYGPASTGGIAIGGGLSARLKGFVIAVDYTYTRFFYAFSDAVNRQNAGQRTAGGALDVYNAFIASGGYSF